MLAFKKDIYWSNWRLKLSSFNLAFSLYLSFAIFISYLKAVATLATTHIQYSIQCSPYQAVTVKFTAWSNTSYHLQPVLLKLNKMFPKIFKLWCKLILTRKGSKYRKRKGIHSYSLWLLYLHVNADWHLSKHWRLTIFSWASQTFPTSRKSLQFPRLVLLNWP